MFGKPTRSPPPTSNEQPVDMDLNKEEVCEAEDAAPAPESIRNMTDDEIATLRKKMVRKIDIVIMPIMGILYILNCEFPAPIPHTRAVGLTLLPDVHRSALAATKLYGIMDDLNMDTTQFATAISILFGPSSPRNSTFSEPIH